MLIPKYKIGDKVFDRFLPKNWDKLINTFTIIGIHYVLPYQYEGVDGIIKNCKGRFEYSLIDFDNNKFIQSEIGLGKRRTND